MGIYHENNQPPVLNGKYVMFCNPNGVYIQFFAVENTYIREYLKQVKFLIIGRVIKLSYGITEDMDNQLDHQQLQSHRVMQLKFIITLLKKEK